MPDLLVRDVSDEVKHALAMRAAQNSRSLQAEARQILTNAVSAPSGGWVDMLVRAFAQGEQDGFEVPERHTARAFNFDADFDGD